jgi:hypothetical protein
MGKDTREAVTAQCIWGLRRDVPQEGRDEMRANGALHNA